MLKKEKTELSGLESYIYHNLQNKDIRWVPLLRAKNLKRQFKDINNDETEEKFNRLFNQFKEFKEEVLH